jgi:predicted nucleic acid-binding protein
MRTFLDTNVVVYAFDTADQGKQERALEVLSGDDRIVVSTQVLLETWWALTRKLLKPLDEDSAFAALEQLCRLPVVPTDSELVLRAVQTSRKYRIAVWDAMILAAAKDAGCARVLSEDLQHGQDVEGVVIVNPFLGAAGNGSSPGP